MSLKCAIELGIPDALHHRSCPTTLPELATALSITASKATFLGHLMAILVRTGFLSRRKPASKKNQISEDKAEELGFGYSLTPASRAIGKGNSWTCRRLYCSRLTDNRRPISLHGRVAQE
ncbi:hypothetical protein NL676_017419 [Syzygium grande]|nr:hypothetical protein NL676_017419 [Syzygium grande]